MCLQQEREQGMRQMDSLMRTLSEVYRQRQMTSTEQGKVGLAGGRGAGRASDGRGQSAHEVRGVRHLDGPAGAGAADGVHRN